MSDALACPRCARPLDAVIEDRFTCRGCGGVFLGREHVSRLLSATGGGAMPHMSTASYRTAPAETTEAQRAVETDVRYLPCPECHKHMNRVRFLQGTRIVVDVCVSHGVWFDAGELDRATDHVLRHGTGERPAGGDEERSVAERISLILEHFGHG